MEENKKDVLPLEGEPLTTPQISEPVVNALAAALNKIETYVPTQYINDGPPDIDAEHLNHAEQAIMRVTNLANGAADAISALQSQVTQLNSDLNPSTMITGGVIDYAESLPICFRTISVNERTSQTPSTLNYGTGYIEKSGETDIVIILHNVVTKETYTKRRSNIGWGDWETYALKSDLALLSFTWTGEATNYIDTSITIDGYKPIAITGLNPTGLGTTEALRYFRFNKNNLRAIASFTAKTVTSCIFDVLCIRI